MELLQVLHMNEGEGKTSYSHNSSIQKQGMQKAKQIIDESIKELCRSSIPNCIRIGDLGCSSGPNSLLLVKQTIDIIDDLCKTLNMDIPKFQVFLNDLPGNDFNTIFKSLPLFYEQIYKEKGIENESCFVAAIPGSFYGRLFPEQFLHFVHSSYSLHWLSKVPEGLMSETVNALNKGDLYISKTSTETVKKAYLDGFKIDFVSFLRARSAEIVNGGLMVLTMVGSERKLNHFKNKRCTVWELLAGTLRDMIIEGSIEETKLDSFNLPYYAPTMEEVLHVVEDEGSFALQRQETFKVDWDAKAKQNDYNCAKGKRVATSIRAVCETLLASHFGNDIMDVLFERYAVKLEEYLEVNIGECTTLVISLIKKSSA